MDFIEGSMVIKEPPDILFGEEYQRLLEKCQRLRLCDKKMYETVKSIGDHLVKDELLNEYDYELLNECDYELLYKELYEPAKERLRQLQKYVSYLEKILKLLKREPEEE